MHAEGFFLQALVYLAAAVVSVPIAKRVGLGSVLGYLLAGMIIGPFVLGLIGKEGQDVMHFAEFGVVMMLFLIGLELKPSLLWRMRSGIVGMGGLQLGLSASAIMLVAVMFGLNWQSALTIGLVLGLSSTAIVLQTLNEKDLMKTDAGQCSFAVLLFQDISVIPMLALFPLLASQPLAADSQTQHATWVDGLSAWAEAGVVLGAMLGIVFVGRLLIRPGFRIIAKTRLRELFTAAALLLVISIAVLMTQVGLSPALGTFLAGVVLADSEYRHELEGDIEPFKGLLLGLFFIAVGASVDFGLITERPGLIMGLVIALMTIKFLVLFLLGRLYKMGMDQNTLLAFTLAQGGEFAFVLFSFASQHRILSEEITDPLVAVVAISMALTPLLMAFFEKVLQPRIGTREQSRQVRDESIESQSNVIIAGFGRFGNIVGRLLRANGIKPTVLDLDSDNVEILRKLGLKVFYGDASRLDLLRAAGASQASVIILAIDDFEKILQIVDTVKKHFPHLHILARAYGRSEAYELLELGVSRVYRDTFDTSLSVGIDALDLLGYRKHQAFRASRLFRRHDETHLRELALMRHDRKAYISLARQRIRDLEEALQSEQVELAKNRDEGWDTSSLRRDLEQLAAE